MQIYSGTAYKTICSFRLAILLSISLINIPIAAEILSPTIEFTVPLNSANGPSEPFTPVVHCNKNTYLVHVDAKFRTLVTQKTCNGTLITVPLDKNPDYTAYTDGHHRFSMGIDENGYLHIAGDMHYYPSAPANYLPLRYQNQTVMYWVSNAPNDITQGFTFAGGLNALTAIPGQFWNTGYFFNNNKKELYYTAMIRSVYNVNARLTGEMGVGLYKYNAMNNTWAALGYTPPVNPANPAGTQYFTSLYWDKSGWGSPVGQPQWFNNYWPSFQFDNQNTLHFSLAVNTNINNQGPTRVIYAKSLDGGVTWRKANGNVIGLPLGGIDGNANLADVVADFGTSLTRPNSNVVADNSGNPAVNIQLWTGVISWYRFNGTAWTTDLNNPAKFWGSYAVLGQDSKITNNAFDRLAVRRSTLPTSASAAYMLDKYLSSSQLNSFICLSQIAAKTTGDVYGLGLSNNLNNIQVIKLNFESQSLPCSWSSQDIGSNISSGGATDYLNGTFTLRSAGSGVTYAKNDSIQFAYRALTGDGTIIARVAGQNVIQYINNSATGVMMRQSLKDSALSVFMGIDVKANGQFVYRNALNGTSQTAAATIATPQWIKIVRVGNLFTAFISPNGVTWTQVGQPQTIVMDNIIYVGLASYSSHLPEVFMSTVDNVSVVSGSNYVTPQ
jgi:hypothetical protein